MKTLINLTFILILFFATSCQKQHDLKSTDSSKNISVLTENSLLNPFTSELLDIANIVMPQISNKNFRSLVYSEIEKKFDGDFNVLINQLPISNQDNNLSSILRESEQKQDYPQIYIPFYETLKENNTLGKKNPVIIINENDETVREYPGYMLTKDGYLEKLDFLITEDYARTNEIWVIGLNERMNVDNLISIDPEDIKKGKDLQPLGSLGPDIYIGSIMIPDLGAVEPWISGKIELVARVLSGSGTNLLQYNYGKIKRSKFKDQKWLNVNTYVTEWVPTLGDNLIVHWTELDGGNGTQTVTVTFPPADGYPGAAYNFQIKSDDDDLGFQICQKTQSSFHIYDSGLIRWKVLKVF